MLKISKCLHTAVLVSDLERSEYFYEQVLGLVKVNRPFKYDGVWYQLGEYQIHLIVDTNYSVNRCNAEKWGRNPHIAVEVEDLESAIAQIEKHGYQIQMSASGRAAFFVGDPDGNIIEITQVSP